MRQKQPETYLETENKKRKLMFCSSCGWLSTESDALPSSSARCRRFGFGSNRGGELKSGLPAAMSSQISGGPEEANEQESLCKEPTPPRLIDRLIDPSACLLIWCLVFHECTMHNVRALEGFSIESNWKTVFILPQPSGCRQVEPLRLEVLIKRHQANRFSRRTSLFRLGR